MLLVTRVIGGNRIIDGDATVTVANDEWVTTRAGRSRGDAGDRDAGEQHLKHNSIGGDHGDPRPQLRSSRAKRRHSASLCPFNTTRMALVEGGSLLRPDMTASGHFRRFDALPIFAAFRLSPIDTMLVLAAKRRLYCGCMSPRLG